jgi:hypothetical protein
MPPYWPDDRRGRDRHPDEVLVGIAGRDVSVGVIGDVVQCHMASIRVKYGDDLRLGSPIGDVIFNELEVEIEAGRSPSNTKVPILNTIFTFDRFTGMSM